MYVMRRTGSVINVVAMLALLAGSIPTSAIASLFVGSCQMECCVEKPAHQMADPVCMQGCDSAKSAHSIPASELRSKEAAGCKCSFGSAPTTPQPDIAATVSTSSPLQHVVADLPPEICVEPTIAKPKSKPGVFGTDSGPPTSRPNCASFGRAPPVLLA
jgi:hypothetical protein